MAEKNTPVVFAAEALKISIGTQQIFDDAELTVHEGERVGLIGRNGCGKSTFLKLIAEPDLLAENGRIRRKKDLRIGYLPQDFTLDSSLDVYGNVRLGVKYLADLLHEYENLPPESHRHHELELEISCHNAWNLDNRLQVIMDALKVPPGNLSVDNLSGGEKRRVLLARELVGDPDLLLLDEPTNHLDAETIEWLEDFIAGYRGTCVIITHDRYFLDRVTNRIIELSWGKFYSYEGNYSDFLVSKAEREMHVEKQEERRQKFLRSEIEWVRSNPKARTCRNQGRLKRYEEISAISAPKRESFMELVIPPAEQLGNKVTSFQNVSLRFGERSLLQDFSFEFEPGMRLGIIGKNGTGKTSFLKLITGELQPSEGTAILADNVRFNYIDQGREHLDDNKTVLEEIGEGCEHVLLGSEKITVWTYLKRFLFADERIKTQISRLSGGERARLMLAKQLKRGGNFIILDEPTNDLDLATLRILEEALCDYRGCIAVVSHDRYFLNRVCSSIMAFENGNNPEYSVGNYEYYHEMKSRRESELQASTSTANSASANDSRKKKDSPSTKKLSYKEQKELDGMEDKIMDIETAIEEIGKLFSSPDFFKENGERIAELNEELSALKAEQERCYARWEELESMKNA